MVSTVSHSVKSTELSMVYDLDFSVVKLKVKGFLLEPMKLINSKPSFLIGRTFVSELDELPEFEAFPKEPFPFCPSSAVTAIIWGDPKEPTVNPGDTVIFKKIGIDQYKKFNG